MWHSAPPSCPFAGDSRVLTPDRRRRPRAAPGPRRRHGAAVVAGAAAVRPLRRLLVAVALGSLVLTFASSDPEREVVGSARLLAAARRCRGARRALVVAPACGRPAHPARRAARPGLRALVVSLLVGAALVAVVVDVPLLARLTEDYDATGAALVLVRFLLAVPVGALLGGWALRHLGDGAVAGPGSPLAGGGPARHVALDARLARRDRADDAWCSSSSASAWGSPSPPSTTRRSPTRRPTRTASRARSSSWPAWSAWSSGWRCSPRSGSPATTTPCACCPTRSTPTALIGAGVVQVQTVFLGGALAALVGAAVALTLGIRRPERVAGESLGSVSPRSRPRRERDRTRPCPCAPHGRSPHRRPARRGRGSRGRSRSACPAAWGSAAGCSPSR